MNNNVRRIFVGLCVLAMACLATAGAQTAEVKEKPPMYSYVGNWTIPRAQWGEMQKNVAADDPILQKALASGTIVGYGDDLNLVHTADGETHDDWWSAMSMAGLLNVLDQFYAAGSSTNPVLATATKHWDEVYVSRYYNWRPGTYKGAYTRVAAYKLKADAPDNAVELLSKSLMVPLMEKMLADGTIAEYEVDTQAIHTEAPGMFVLVFIAPSADGLDKVNAALQQAMKASPLGGPALISMVDYSAHRDGLLRTNATYK